MKTKRILSIALTLVMLLGMLPGMNLTAYAANNLTIYIMDMLENMDDNEWGYQLYDGDVSIAEGTYVQCPNQYGHMAYGCHEYLYEWRGGLYQAVGEFI